jgi:hypothetical protein
MPTLQRYQVRLYIFNHCTLVGIIVKAKMVFPHFSWRQRHTIQFVQSNPIQIDPNPNESPQTLSLCWCAVCLARTPEPATRNANQSINNIQSNAICLISIAAAPDTWHECTHTNAATATQSHREP